MNFLRSRNNLNQPVNGSKKGEECMKKSTSKKRQVAGLLETGMAAVFLTACGGASSGTESTVGEAGNSPACTVASEAGQSETAAVTQAI